MFDLKTAQQIANSVVASHLRFTRSDGSQFTITVAEAITAITVPAERLHFRLTSHAALWVKAKVAGVAPEDKVTAAQASGGLTGIQCRVSATPAGGGYGGT